MDETNHKLRIRELIESWAIWRDTGDWERLRGCWHEDGWMIATVFQGPADHFVAATREASRRAFHIVHFLGGMSIDIARTRAVAQTNMTLMQRAPVDRVECDVTCTGRFYDFLEERHGRWGIVLRYPVFEKDRIDPVDPSARLALDPTLLAAFPEGYRHLAYLQTRAGFTVKRDLPGLRGPEIERLYARGAAWLAGERLDRG
jgi:hypothetical protein